MKALSLKRLGKNNIASTFVSELTILWMSLIQEPHTPVFVPQLQENKQAF
jgi:hypothetical protein